MFGRMLPSESVSLSAESADTWHAHIECTEDMDVGFSTIIMISAACLCFIHRLEWFVYMYLVHVKKL